LYLTQTIGIKHHHFCGKENNFTMDRVISAIKSLWSINENCRDLKFSIKNPFIIEEETKDPE